MRCKLCIFENISSDGDGDAVPTQSCEQCRCHYGANENGGTSANLSKHQMPSLATQSFQILISDPLKRLIMESFPVKVEWSSVLGRYLVATRDIKREELIFHVQPICAGPTPSYTEKDWICMSCFRVSKKKTMVRCSDCQWPFCCKECEEDDVHKELECLVLAKAKVLPEDNYTDHITLMQLLRCLLTKHKDPEGWQQLLSMESHVEGRKHSSSDIWERWRTEEIKFIRETLDLKEFDEEEINFVSGVLSMNAFGSNDIHGHRHRHGSYLYYIGAMAAHDCAPNTDYEVDENQDFILKAIVDIPKGCQITLSYALPFQGTLLRREYLKDYFFDCCCKRCADVTEFGSNFSALKCSSCENGILLPDHPLAEESPWKCSEGNCSGVKSAFDVLKIVKEFDVMRESPEYASDTPDFLKNIENMERLLEKGEPIFHTNNFVMMGIEFQLIQKIQYYMEIKKISLTWNDRLLLLTHKHLQVGQTIWPGWNDRYGRLLYLLQSALLNSISPNCANVALESQGRTKALEIESQVLKQVMKIRKDARKILLSKPSGSYEHTLGLKLKRIMDMEVTEADLIAKLQKL